MRLLRDAWLGNEAELAFHLTRHEREPEWDLLELSGRSTPEARQRWHAMHNAVVRTLMNWSLSGKVLADHTRKVIELYEGTPTYELYGEWSKPIRESDVIAVVHRLRTYITHYAVPNTAASFWDGDGSELHMAIALSTSGLEWDDWGKRAQRWLDARPRGTVILLDLVKEYGSQQRAIQGWIEDHVAQFMNERVLRDVKRSRSASGGGND